MKVGKKLALSLVCGAIAGAAGLASAATVSSLMFPFTQLEDDSAEFLSVDANENGLLDVGDTIRGIINFPQLINLENSSQTVSLGGGSGNEELTALFSATVVSKTFAGSFTIGSNIYNTYNYIFGPTAGFYAGNANAMALLYVDQNSEFVIGGTGCTNTAPGGDCETNITNGTLWAVLGFGDPDDSAFANGLPDDLGFFSNLLTSQAAGQAYLNFSILENYTGLTFGQVSCGIFCNNNTGSDGFVDVAGSGSFLGTRGPTGDPVTPYAFTNDTDFTVAVIPEPGTLALVGLALAGIGFGKRRRDGSSGHR